MGNIIQDVIPFGGMNTDDDSHLFPDGDYRYAENVRNATSEEGNIGAFENILGNLKVSNTDLWTINSMEVGFGVQIPNTAIHTCIGSCIDITTNCVYYIVHTSTFELYGSEYVADSIFEYNKDTNTISTVLRDVHFAYRTYSYLFEKILNFSLDHPINGMFVVDGMLFFNDGYNPPRKINILRAKQFMQSVNNPMYFSDNYFVGGNVGFVVSPTVYNAITVGDRIQVFQDLGATHPEYDGTTTITNKIIDGTTYVIVVNKPFLGDTPAQGGFIYKNYGGYSIPFKEVFMDRIKHPPLYAPTSYYSNDVDYEFNNLSSLQFQFAYKYIYDDKEESTLSPISKIPLFSTIISGSVFISGNNNENNVIIISINTGENNVKGIKLYARSTSETNGDNPVTVNCNNSDWWLIDELTKYNDSDSLIIDDNIEYPYSFYNSQNKQYGDQTDLNRPFDYVPQICATSEIVENSRIVDGDIIEGYDNTDLDVDLEFTPVAILDKSLNVYTASSYNTSLLLDGSYFTCYLKVLTVPQKSEVSIGQTMVFQIIPIAGSAYRLESIPILITQTIYDNYPLLLKKEIYNIMKSKDFIVSMSKSWGAENTHQRGFFSSDILYDTTVYPFIKYNGISGYYVGLIYSQHNRQNWISTNYPNVTSFFDTSLGGDIRNFFNNSLTDNVPTYSDYDIVFIQRANTLYSNQNYIGTDVTDRVLVNVDIKLIGEISSVNSRISCKQNDYHEFGIVYSDRAGRTSFVNKNEQLKKYLETYLKQTLADNKYFFIPKFTINHTPPTWATNYEFVYNPYGIKEYSLQYYTQSIVYDTSMTKINIGGLITQVNTLYSQTIIEPYIWQRGDRISIMTQKDGTTLLTTKQDHEIVKADATYIWVQSDLTGVVGISGVTPSSDEGWLYEIYRPAKTNKESVYFYIGEKYPIINGYHMGGEQNQTSSQPAIVTIQTGNCYVKRGYYLTVDGYREDSNAYDFFKSDGLDLGRPNIANVNAKQQRLFNHIRFSGQLFQNTQINNLCRNDASDYIQVSSKFGAITKLVEIGYVLKVLQEKNLNSVYLSRTQLTNTDGSTNLSAVNTPLGTINPSESLYGSKYPRSVIRNNRSLYFLDTMQGAFIKDDNNGSEQISETRKMNRFFTDLCRKIESGLYTVVMTGSYDIRHEEAILSVNLEVPVVTEDLTYDDWYLGSRDEMVKVARNLVSGIDENNVVFTPITGFLNKSYWTSSEILENTACTVNLTTGTLGLASRESEKIYVRPVRNFDSETVYTLRQDLGYGYVYYIQDLQDGTFRYYVCAYTEAETKKAWCTNGLIGTSNAIGEGQHNTTLMLAKSAETGQTGMASHWCDEYTITITVVVPPVALNEYHTIAYSEIKNKFTTFYTYNTEQLENIGQQLISFKNGELYLHNKTTNYNEFYGVDYPQKITIVGNKNPKFNKIFTNTAIRTNGEWNVPEIRILPTLNYPIGMKSRLKKNKFVNKEGVQYASFMNDMTDPRYATPSEALINGRPLRGECVEIDYQNESTDRCVTLMFTIGMTNSELGV